MFHQHTLGHVIRELRRMALDGARPNQILSYLRRCCGSDDELQYDYLRAAYLPGSTSNVFRFTIPPFRTLTMEEEERTHELIVEHIDQWRHAPFPELIRVRDYFSFLEFAKEEGLLVTVCGANPSAAPYIGGSGYGCFRDLIPVFSRRSPPNEGLIAADPGDPSLAAALQLYTPTCSYATYVEGLKTAGYGVTGAEDGYVIVDARGRRFYEGYRLHGVYDFQSGSPAWTPRRGEQLRRELNRRLGADLVTWAPHDEWVHRNDRQTAGPFYGPQLPALAFYPNNEIDPLLKMEDMGWAIPAISRRWPQLYPDHKVKT
jgi:hypothetical protein